ncbi:MAG: serine/threonine protein kinase [Planctomycetia bacterium]|nr:serine/threonine protein kinase [Planctomycetia bacterium]
MSAISSSFVGTNRLLYLIRSGRYCQVWAAIDDSRQRRCAIKFLLPEFRSDKEQVVALQNEFAIGSKLDHPLLLGAHEYGEAGCGPYVLMELFAGLNLRDVLNETWKDMLCLLPTIVAQAAESASRLNEHGFLHLDLKPDNYILNEHGEIRLIDFALARRPPKGWERWFWKRRQRSIQGTRSYLSPEQIRREPVDLRSDVYSLGCTFFHLATGIPPYTASTSNELLTKHLHFPLPNPETDNPSVTSSFAQLVMKMMAKDPADRPPSAAEVSNELKRISVLKDDEVASKPARPTLKSQKSLK